MLDIQQDLISSQVNLNYPHHIIKNDFLIRIEFINTGGGGFNLIEVNKIFLKNNKKYLDPIACANVIVRDGKLFDSSCNYFDSDLDCESDEWTELCFVDHDLMNMGLSKLLGSDVKFPVVSSIDLYEMQRLKAEIGAIWCYGREDFIYLYRHERLCKYCQAVLKKEQQ